ncbi:hypothetical protein [Lentzea nigeriaca]|uniref:hypothetical protein n=1 Tax=Lentzea nigeriaca TaxID=1128665 RepID=UPI00195ECC90|nr:hypothetical protein [Lentzea nigeriaca]MBM7859828.1 hypothetical protein [Lentzea nigeriaca]
MPDVLLIGFAPDTIPGFEPGAVAAQLREGSARFEELGMTEEQCLVGFGDPDAAATVVEHLKRKLYDCVVVGGGIRKPAEFLELFQSVVNLVHRHQPQAAIAFNSGPTDSADWALKALEQRAGTTSVGVAANKL